MARYTHRQERLEAIRSAGRIRRMSSFGSYYSANSSTKTGCTGAGSIKSSSKISASSLPPPPPPPPPLPTNKMSRRSSKSDGRDGILKMKPHKDDQDDQQQYPEPIVTSTFSTAPSSSFDETINDDDDGDDSLNDIRTTIKSSSSGIISSTSSFSTAAADGVSSLTSPRPNNKTTITTTGITVTTTAQSQLETDGITIKKSGTGESSVTKPLPPPPSSVFRRRGGKALTAQYTKPSTTTTGSGSVVSFIGIGNARERIANIDSASEEEEVLDEDDHVEDSQRIPTNVFLFPTSGSTLEAFEDEPLSGARIYPQEQRANNSRISNLVRGLVRFGSKTFSSSSSSSHHRRSTNMNNNKSNKYQSATPTIRQTLPLGTRCLVLKGTDSDDVGQEAVVIGHTPKRVKVSYLNPHGQVAQKLKDPTSLVAFDSSAANIRMFEHPVTRQLWITTDRSCDVNTSAKHSNSLHYKFDSML